MLGVCSYIALDDPHTKLHIAEKSHVFLQTRGQKCTKFKNFPGTKQECVELILISNMRNVGPQ